MCLATKWVDSAKLQLFHGCIKESFEAPLVELLELCDNSPREALNVIYDIIALSPPNDVIGYLGAGPLEDILRANHELFLDEVIEKSNNDALLRLCMQSVDLDDSGCDRVEEFDSAATKSG